MELLIFVISFFIVGFVAGFFVILIMSGFFNILYRFMWRKSRKDLLSQEFLPDVINTAKERHVTLGNRWSGGGSGVLMDHTHIITAKHCWNVIKRPQRLKMRWNGRIFWVNVVLYQSFGMDVDVVVLKICNYIFPAHALCPADTISINSLIFSFNSILSRKKILTCFGKVISKLNSQWVRCRTGWPSSTLTSKVKRPCISGMSGSGVYDKNGKLAGILVGSLLLRNHIYIVPINHFRSVFVKQKKTVA